MTDIETVDTIVVGAGVGGLSAAIRLGSAGLRVLVLESGGRIGGKAGMEVVDGVAFDTGPSVLTLPEVFDEVFAHAGLDFRHEVELLQSDPGFRYHFPSGAVLDVYSELPRTLDSVGSVFGARAREEFASYLKHAASIWQSAAPHFVWSEAPDLTSLIFGGLGRLLAVRQIDAMRTLKESIERLVRTPELRMLLERYATYNGSDVRRAPATLGCIAHVELALGGYGVKGGMYRLVEALGRAAERVGVEIRTNSPVANLLLGSGAIRGVRMQDGREIRSSHVVVNADVGHLKHALLPAEQAHVVEVDGEPSMSAYNAVYRARRRTAPKRVAHEVIFPSDYLAEFRDIFDGKQSPREPTIYMCAQEICHGKVGFCDEEPLFVMANAPAFTKGAIDVDASELRTRVDERLRQLGFLESSDVPVFVRSPSDLARLFPGSRGSLYGLGSNSATSAFKRPPNEIKKLPGLYLASGSAHPGGGLPMVAQSGQLAARAILKHLAPAQSRHMQAASAFTRAHFFGS
ncbi:MAG TPA: phytoene desaturase family protein [Polyangiaceae bacterium]